MTEERHTAVLAWRKATLWVLAVLCVLEILQKDAVVNALWLFCTAGVVPGRKQPLAPDTVLWILAGVVGIALLTISIRLIIRVFSRRRKDKTNLRRAEALSNTLVLRHNENSVKTTVQPMAATELGLAQLPQKTQAPHIPAPPIIIPITRNTQSFSVIPLLKIGLRFVLYMGWFGRVLESLVRIVAHYSLEAATKIATQISIRVVAAVRWTKKYTKIFIKWLVPRLHEFDTWLEVQAHRLVAKTHKKASKHEKLQNVALLARESRRAMNARLPLLRAVKGEQGSSLSD